MSIRINVLGELTVLIDGKAIGLPSSKRTRALLAYLAVTARPHRRDRLCEVFWKIPDDPRAALRWSLSKLRPFVNSPSLDRLIADRERVQLNTDDIDIDLVSLQKQSTNPTQSVEALRLLANSLSQVFLEDTELPSQVLFQQWLEAERNEVQASLSLVLKRLSVHNDLDTPEQLMWARKWAQSDPFNTQAATCVLSYLDKLGKLEERNQLSHEYSLKFEKADIKWPPENNAEYAQGTKRNKANAEARQMLLGQKIRFCTTADNVRIAHASVGKGPPIVKAANWFSHLELDWDAPIWSSMYRELSRHHNFIRYDERGNGLSDWQVQDISFEAFVKDLETVVDANELDDFVLLGISQGAAVSIEYAIRHPNRVKKLVLFGGYAQGWRIGATEQTITEREAVMTLTGLGWGQNNPAYRQIFSSTFLPSATSEEHAWFNDFQRLTTSPENAVRFLSVFGHIDVKHQLSKLRVPTMVIHSLGDQRIPVEVGRSLADAIPKAEFVGLKSDGHLLLGREPASRDFVDNVRRFIS